MAYTQADLVREVLAELGALDGSNVVFSEDSAKVVARLPDIVADLAARRITGTITLSAIADAVFADLVKVVAERVAHLFGRQTDPQAIAGAEARLGQAYRLDRSLSTTFVRAVLERLDAVGGSTNAVDATVVSAQVPRTLASLAANRVITIANEAAIATKHFPHVLTLVAADCLPKAVSAEDVAAALGALQAIDRLDSSASSALVLAVLEQLAIWGAASPVVNGTLVAGRVQSTLDNLAARNVIYIADEDSIATVSPAAFEPLVRYIAAGFAPAAAGNVGAQAERELRTIARIGRGTGAMLTVDPALRTPRRGGSFNFTRGY